MNSGCLARWPIGGVCFLPDDNSGHKNRKEFLLWYEYKTFAGLQEGHEFEAAVICLCTALSFVAPILSLKGPRATTQFLKDSVLESNRSVTALSN